MRKFRFGGSAFNSVREKRIRSGSVLSETKKIAAQRAVLRAALKKSSAGGSGQETVVCIFEDAGCWNGIGRCQGRRT